MPKCPKQTYNKPSCNLHLGQEIKFCQDFRSLLVALRHLQSPSSLINVTTILTFIVTNFLLFFILLSQVNYELYYSLALPISELYAIILHSFIFLYNIQHIWFIMLLFLIVVFLLHNCIIYIWIYHYLFINWWILIVFTLKLS